MIIFKDSSFKAFKDTCYENKTILKGYIQTEFDTEPVDKLPKIEGIVKKVYSNEVEILIKNLNSLKEESYKLTIKNIIRDEDKFKIIIHKDENTIFVLETDNLFIS